MKKTRKAVVLTINGKAELVIQDAASYQRLLDTKAQYQTRVAIDQALEDMRKGLHRPVTNVFAAIRTKHGLHERWLDHLAAHRACMGRRAHLVVMPRDLPRRNNGSSQR